MQAFPFTRFPFPAGVPNGKRETENAFCYTCCRRPDPHDNQGKIACHRFAFCPCFGTVRGRQTLFLFADILCCRAISDSKSAAGSGYSASSDTFPGSNLRNSGQRFANEKATSNFRIPRKGSTPDTCAARRASGSRKSEDVSLFAAFFPIWRENGGKQDFPSFCLKGGTFPPERCLRKRKRVTFKFRLG